jgi:phosphoribosylglycinamide formyltransferase 1
MTRPDTKARVVVLISGGGSNLQTLIDAASQPDCPYEISHVVANRPHAGGLARAQSAGIANSVIDHKGFRDRASFEADLGACIDAVKPDFIVCAGFMRVLTEAFVSKYNGCIINIHPSLLPNFRGLHTHARAIEAGVGFAGCTVHWVTAGVDEGAIIGQAIVTLLPGDTPKDLAARVLVQEHKLYPACLVLVASRRAILKDGHTWIDGQRGALAMSADGTIANFN